jgi:hypothetical protein
MVRSQDPPQLKTSEMCEVENSAEKLRKLTVASSEEMFP